ncbi:MAG: 2'-deoxycytidine 5'-triphosphate deaminase [Planctomycetes bacterium]|nr:2'-deoxycytidine 5'-triphosphate deaminase [Planctomycetota bacterium]
MHGTFPSQEIARLVKEGAISSSAGIAPEQIQPSSLDLTLSVEAYSMTGSLLPLGGEKVRDLIERFARYPISLREPAVLVRDNVYLVRMRESLNLPQGVAAYANNKSSTGRIDLQTRVICDRNPRYDRVPEGYAGELWLEIIPKSFDVKVRGGDSVNQCILYQGRTFLDAAELAANLSPRGERQRTNFPNGKMRELASVGPLLYDRHGKRYAGEGAYTPLGDAGLLMTLDLDQEIVGFVAKKSLKPKPIDLAALGKHDPEDYFEPIKKPKDGALFLSQNAFYIFSTYEYISVPPDYAVEMLPYDTSAGEFRAHYAGFFDPGFGYGAKGEVKGTPAVLEVRPYEDDLIVRHRQPVCKMAYEKLTAPPDKLYGVGVKSNYAAQRGPRLSKFFKG